jgi:hypothetical protein
MSLYERHPHPRIEQRKLQAPPTVNEHRLRGDSRIARFNARLGLAITEGVGTMWSAYAFCVLALLSLPAVLSAFNAFSNTFPNWMINVSLIALIAWVAQTFLQLVLLPIIIVGQNIQSKAADARADATYKDAEAVLHEAEEIQEHLAAQDTAIEHILEHLGLPSPPPPPTNPSPSTT